MRATETIAVIEDQVRAMQREHFDLIASVELTVTALLVGLPLPIALFFAF